MRGHPSGPATPLASGADGRPTPRGPRRRGRRRLAGRRDRRRAPARAVLRRLDDRLGEHDRHRARRAVGRLLDRRAPGRPRPAPCAAVPRRARRRGAARAPSRSSRGPFLDVSVEALDAIPAGAFVGSLFGVLVLVAVPVLLLGAVAPYAIRLSVARRGRGRRASPGGCTRSRPSGSLVGTFLARAAADPARWARGARSWPSRWRSRWSPRSGCGAPLRRSRRSLLAALIALPARARSRPRGGGAWSDERETAYQYARVVERADGERRLELNEGQARPLALPPGQLPDRRLLGRAARAAVRRRRRAPPRSVAILGNAAGTTARAYGHFFPRTRVDGVEIDRELTEVGRALLRPARRRTCTCYTADARPFLRAHAGASTRSSSTPTASPTSRSTWPRRSSSRSSATASTRAAWWSSTSATRRTRDALEKVLSATMRAAFPTVLRDPVERRQHAAGRPAAPGSARALGGRAPRCPPRCGPSRRRRRAAGAAAARRRRLHRRPRAGRVADRRLDRPGRRRRPAVSAAHGYALRRASVLAVAPEDLWARVGTIDGANLELAPWLRMTAPRHVRRLEDLPDGRPGLPVVAAAARPRPRRPRRGAPRPRRPAPRVPRALAAAERAALGARAHAGGATPRGRS